MIEWGRVMLFWVGVLRISLLLPGFYSSGAGWVLCGWQGAPAATGGEYAWAAA